MEPIAPDGEIMAINGKQVGSRNEWYIYQALRYRGVPTWAIEYQVYWGGGRMLGGQVLDFVVDLGGTPFIIRVMGKYWHPGESGTPLDAFTKAGLLQAGYQVFDVWDYRCQSREAAINELQRQGLVI
jgi:hypothetical protein